MCGSVSDEKCAKCVGIINFSEMKYAACLRTPRHTSQKVGQVMNNYTYYIQIVNDFNVKIEIH